MSDGLAWVLAIAFTAVTLFFGARIYITIAQVIEIRDQAEEVCHPKALSTWYREHGNIYAVCASKDIEVVKQNE